MTSLATAFVTIRPDTTGFGARLSKSTSLDADKAGKKAGGKFSSGLKSTLKLGGALAGAFAVTKGVSFFKDSIREASDLKESASKVGVVFGEQAGQIVKASKTSATAMGLSKNAYLDATGTLGNLLTSLDIAPKKSAKMSQSIVKLAGDLASFNNVSPEEALAALKSGLTGETEPLKRFGVNMNETTLKAEALAQGIVKPTKDAAKIKAYYAKVTIAQDDYNKKIKEFGPNSMEALKAQSALGTAQSGLRKATEGTLKPLTAQEKALAAQGLIMKQTKTAQGDFARTSGGLANQQRILKAQFDDVKGSVGRGLLPIITKFVNFLNDTGIPAVKTLAKFIVRNKDVIGPLVGVVASVVAGFKIWSIVMGVFNAVLAANPISLVIIAIAALAAGVVIAYKRSETFRKVVDAAWAGIKTAISFAWNKVIKPVFKALVTYYTKTLPDGIRAFKNAVVTGFKAVRDFIKLVALKITDFMLRGVERIISGFAKLPGKLGAPFRSALGKVKAFRADVNREMDAINDETVRISLTTIKSTQAHNQARIGDPAGGKGPIPRSAMGGLGLIPKVSGNLSGARAAASSTAQTRHEIALQAAEGIQDKLEAAAKKAAAAGLGAIGVSGSPGTVMRRGSYSIGMPYHGYPGHNGADYPAATGTPVFSPWPGRVVTSADLPGSNPYNSTPYRSYGRYIRIAHPNGLTTLYAHLSARGVATGQQVNAGQGIGRVGMNGNATGPHLHFEAARNGATFNPSGLGLFDKGGMLGHGGMALNLSSQPERILTGRQTELHDRQTSALEALARGGGGAVEMTITNWDTGQGYIRGLARSEVKGAAGHAATARRRGSA